MCFLKICPMYPWVRGLVWECHPCHPLTSGALSKKSDPPFPSSSSELGDVQFLVHQSQSSVPFLVHLWCAFVEKVLLPLSKLSVWFFLFLPSVIFIISVFFQLSVPSEIIIGSKVYPVIGFSQYLANVWLNQGTLHLCCSPETPGFSSARREPAES